MPNCNDCHEEFRDWGELARHIISQKKTHGKKSRVWALHFLSDKKNVVQFNGRLPMPEGVKMIAKECVRELSGQTETARTLCPNCKRISEQRIEAEYIEDRTAWRNSLGTLIVNCEGCKK